MTKYHIQAKNIHFSYDKKTAALSNVNFLIERNQVVAFVGPNGGGKTTLLRIIAGLIKPDTGHLDINYLSNNTSLVGYVPQYADFDKQFPMTVFDVVLSGLIKPFGFYSKKEKKSAQSILEKLDLGDLKDRPISDLSGGQIQRTLIARALVSPKEILLLDEPTANIDKQSTERLTKLINELSKTLTIILVTHDINFVHDNAHRLFKIDKTLEELPMNSILNSVQAISPHTFIYQAQNDACRQVAL